uniref:Uncharacterized protein n=1 Tax=viral metagenome TaxID=1070528 RepID=A0A6M3K3V0_9ZZZZ
MENLTMREILTGHIQPKEQTDGEICPEYPHIKIKNLEHLHKAKEFAEKNNITGQNHFEHYFAYLERILTNEGTIAEIHPDVTSHSFYFNVFKGKEWRWNGGIILHGYQRSYSVELGPKEGMHWSMHT